MASFAPLPALAGGVLIGVASVWLFAAGGLAHKFGFDSPGERGNIHAPESETAQAP
jgi:hypothetical protein